jgi:hypothetical protein
LRDDPFGVVAMAAASSEPVVDTRDVHFLDAGHAKAGVLHLSQMTPSQRFDGLLVLETPWTTIVLDPGAAAMRTANGTVVIEPWADEGSQLLAVARQDARVA